MSCRSGGFSFTESKGIIQFIEPGFLDESVFIYITTGASGHFGKCGVRELGVRLAELRDIASNVVVILTNPVKDAIREGIGRLINERGAET